MISVLGEQGINVPGSYGFCQDPPCILMHAVPGNRDMAEAASAAQLPVGIWLKWWPRTVCR